MEKGEEAHSSSHSCHCGSWHNASTVPTPSQHQRILQGYRFFTCILARTRVTGIVNSVRSRKCFHSAKYENLKYIRENISKLLTNYEVLIWPSKFQGAGEGDAPSAVTVPAMSVCVSLQQGWHHHSLKTCKQAIVGVTINTSRTTGPWIVIILKVDYVPQYIKSFK